MPSLCVMLKRQMRGKDADCRYVWEYSPLASVMD